MEDEFWYVSVFGTPWFDSGYILGVSCDCALAFRGSGARVFCARIC